MPFTASEPIFVSVPKSLSVTPGASVLLPASTQYAPGSTTMLARLTMVLPSPASVPVLAPEASSNTSVAVALPTRSPIKLAPGSTTSVPEAANDTALAGAPL